MKLHRHQRAILGGLIWVAVGVMLAVRGFGYWQEEVGGDADSSPLIPLLIGAIIGGAKGFFVLRKSAKRTISRIKSQPGKQWFWQMYPPYLYILIPVMVALGFAIRYFLKEDYPGVVLAVYVGIGAAMIISSIPFFTASGEFKEAA